MLACKKRYKSLLPSVALSFFLFLAPPAFASPLRIWVMPNEPAGGISHITSGQIQDYTNKVKQNGIFIENDIRDLIQPSGIDNVSPIGSYIIGNNQLVEELKEFKKKEGTDEPISIKFIRWSDAFNTLMSAGSMPIDEMPDIVQVGSTWIASFAHRGVLENLEGIVNEADFAPSAIQSSKPFDAKGLYAVPWFMDVRVMFYWKDMLSESAFTDWHAFESECHETMKNNPGLDGLIGFPLAMTWNLLHNLAPWLWAGGGDILEARTFGSLPFHSVSLDSPESLAAVTFLRNLSKERCAVLEDVNTETMETRFLGRKIASIISIPAFRSRLPDGWESKIGIALPPAGPSGSVPFVGGSHLAIWSDAKTRGNLKRALSLVSFLTSAASELRYSNSIGFLPASRNALQDLSGAPYMNVFNEALSKGRSYPPIAEWGTVVENEFIRNHLWNIWQAVAQGQSDETLKAVVRNAAHELRKNMVLAVWHKSRWYALSMVSFIIGAGMLLLIRSRRLYGRVEMQLNKTSRKLIGVDGEKTALQGQILLLERRHEKKSKQIEELRQKISKLNDSATVLSKQLSSMQAKQHEAAKPLMGRIRVAWDGRLFLDGNNIAFENANQAHRLIDHILRQIVNGVAFVSCLWGYPLFGWDSKKLQSLPNRLFNTAVAKINSAITAHKLPPLLKSEGRHSWRWRCLWNAELLTSNSDVTAAIDLLSLGRKALNDNDPEEASKHIARAVDTDPKCFDAFALLSLIGENGNREISRVKSILAENIAAYASDLKNGAKAIERLKSENGAGKYVELLEDEAVSMNHRANHIMKYTGASALKKPLHLNDIISRLTAIQEEIMNLKSSGVVQKGVWATIVGHEKFLGLMAIPKVQSLVNRFYNPETKMVEDPRLVQLALILMIAKPEYLEPLESAKTDDEFFAGFEKQLHKQFRALEQEISLSC